MVRLTNYCVYKRFVRRVVDVQPYEADVKASTRLKNAEQKARPLIELFYVICDVDLLQMSRGRIENMNGPWIRKPACPAVRCILSLDGARIVSTASEPKFFLARSGVPRRLHDDPHVRLHSVHYRGSLSGEAYLNNSEPINPAATFCNLCLVTRYAGKGVARYSW